LLTGKKLRITAEDLAGNRSTEVTGFLEEVFFIKRWDTEETLFTRNEDTQEEGDFLLVPISGQLTRSGLHSLEVMETFRLPISSSNV